MCSHGSLFHPPWPIVIIITTTILLCAMCIHTWRSEVQWMPFEHGRCNFKCLINCSLFTMFDLQPFCFREFTIFHLCPRPHPSLPFPSPPVCGHQTWTRLFQNWSWQGTGKIRSFAAYWWQKREPGFYYKGMDNPTLYLYWCHFITDPPSPTITMSV